MIQYELHIECKACREGKHASCSQRADTIIIVSNSDNIWVLPPVHLTNGSQWGMSTFANVARSLFKHILTLTIKGTYTE